jgi:hypothetical protein
MDILDMYINSNKNKKNILNIFPALLLMIVFVPALQAAEMYTWVDANGAKHYSDKPTKKAVKVNIDVINVKQDEDTDEDQASTEKTDSSSTGFTIYQKERLLAECNKARFNLDAISSGKELMKKDADGNDVKMSISEVATQFQKNKSYLNLYCANIE